MRIFDFNRVVYKGNINRDFYLFCLKKDWKLIKYLFIFIFYFLGSFVSKKLEGKYQLSKFSYFKDVVKLNDTVEAFYDKYKKKIDTISYSYSDKDLVIAKYPEILVEPFIDKKFISYKLDKDFNVDLKEYNENIEKLKKKKYEDGFGTCRSLELVDLCEKWHFVRNRAIKEKNLKTTLKILKKVGYVALIFVLPFLITVLSFAYANPVVDKSIIPTYFADLKLLFLNYLPIFLFFLLIFFISKRIYVSFGITSFIVLIIGIINQTKLVYRDDFFIFEDILLYKEAAIMATRYSIIIAWYTVVAIILLIIAILFFKKNVKKLNINIFVQIVGIICVLFGAYYSYKNLLIDQKTYDSVGDLSKVNRWIATRQYQVRGLVYPFIYTSKDFIKVVPEGYDEEKAKDILEQYEYSNIPDDQKVNVIAVMLEAFNDFSTFETVEFTKDIYGPLHDIQKKSYSGRLITNIFGGGTINTERLFLTGYKELTNFRRVSNSYVRYFKEQGYNTDSFHPIYGAFYNRNTVNLNLGFDNYYNYENRFSKIDESFLGDVVFFDSIIEEYENSVSAGIPYFSFSVTYQNHGPYSTTLNEEGNTYIPREGYTETSYNVINNYFDGIYKTNLALEKLINYFEKEEEPVVVIFFGDHNPFLNDGKKAYQEMNIDHSLKTLDSFIDYYATPYVIFANDAAKTTLDRDFVGVGNEISPTFLMNEFFDYVGWQGNEYLQYTSNLKKQVDVINKIYYKTNGEYVLKNKFENPDLINEFEYVSYYWSYADVRSTN